MEFPAIIQNLLDCPALLRLRDVRMANNQFVAFPSFANTSRYEHSLGVCYLAGICADKLLLSDKDKIELMMACLYHDVGTPPFAHAMEEVLQAKYGFNHEENLRHLIEGTNKSLIGSLDQIYLGEAIKLRSVCQSKQGRDLGLDVYRIARIIVGDENDPLSILLNGNGMDLDNIDNVIRASSAMGIISREDIALAKTLASAFLINDEGKICYDALFMNEIKRWQYIRDIQYTAIFDSKEDFAYQTMIKKALEYLISDEQSKYKLSVDSWKLTDSEILYEYLMRNKNSAPIMRDLLLNKPFRCLGVLYVSGEKASMYINQNKEKIEKTVSAFFSDLMGLNDESSVFINFYPDKRKRPIKTEAIMMGTSVIIDDDSEQAFSGALLGLFTPYLSNRFVTQLDSEGKEKRKKITYSLSSNLNMIMDLLQTTIFYDFEVTRYGEEHNGKTTGNASFHQLGFF